MAGYIHKNNVTLALIVTKKYILKYSYLSMFETHGLKIAFLLIYQNWLARAHVHHTQAVTAQNDYG